MSRTDQTPNPAIYAQLLQHCTRYAFPQRPWSRHRTDLDAFVAPEDSADTLQALRKQFGDEPLLESGVAVLAPDGTLQLAPSLAAGQALVAFRKSDGSPPFTILTAEGCINGAIPVLAACKDVFTRQALHRVQNLYVAFSVHDVIALRAVGLPATLIGPIERLSRAALVRVGKSAVLRVPQASPATAGPRPAPAPPTQPFSGSGGEPVEPNNGASAHEQPLQLVLLCWSPAALTADASPELRSVCEHLSEFYRLCVDIGEWVAWPVSQDSLKSIRFALTHGTVPEIGEALVNELVVHDVYDIVVGTVDPERPEASQQAVWSRMRQLRPRRTAERAELWKQYEQLIERDYLQPLENLARAQEDPHERNQILARAGVYRMTHTLSARLTEVLAELQDVPPARWKAVFPTPQLQAVLELVDRTLAFDQPVRPRRRSVRRSGRSR